MKSREKFWCGLNMEAAQLAEGKNCRLYFEILGGMFYVVEKFKDGSVLHTKETEKYKSRDINQILKFLNT